MVENHTCHRMTNDLAEEIRGLLKKHQIQFEMGRCFGIKYIDVHGDKNRFIEDVATLVRPSGEKANE